MRIGLHAILLLALAEASLLATAGLAEWEIRTPGGALISYVDTFLAKHGVCLRTARPETIHMSHVEWWIPHRNALAGKARKGFFLFDETSRSALLFATEQELNRAVSERRLGPPSGARMTPADGWRQVWEPVFAQRCQQLNLPDNPELQAADQATKAQMRSFCEQFQKRPAQ